MKDIIKQLNHLKNIEPSSAFKEKSRGLILCVSPKTNRIEWRSLLWAGFATIFLLIFVTVSNLSKTTISSLDANRLNKEFSNFNINIQLQEIAYQQTLNQTIASALNEISNNNIKHLNKSLLETEQNNVNINDSANPEIDQLLNEILF